MKDKTKKTVKRVLVIFLIGLLSLPLLFLGVAIAYGSVCYHLNPKYQDANWVSEDGSIVLYERRGKIKTEEGTLEFFLDWEESHNGAPRFRLLTQDLYNTLQHPHTYYEAFYVKWEYRYFFKNSFKMVVKESDFMEEGKVYTFRRTNDETEAAEYPIHVTDSPATESSALFHRAEYDLDLTWDEVLPLFEENGYLSEKEDHSPMRVYKRKDFSYEFMEITRCDSVDRAKESFQRKLSECSVAKGVILRINEGIVTASCGAAKELAQAFGITLPREYATVEDIVLFPTAHELLRNFEEELENAGFQAIRWWNYYQESSSTSHYSCVSPDGSYSFSIVYAGTTAKDVADFLRNKAFPSIQGVVFVECHLPKKDRDAIYLLAVPLEEVQTVLKIITTKTD